MQRLIRELAQDYKTDLRFHRQAIAMLHASVEAYAVEVLEAATVPANSYGLETVMPKHIIEAVGSLDALTSIQDADRKYSSRSQVYKQFMQDASGWKYL